MKPYPKPEKREKKKPTKIKLLSDKRAKLEREHQIQKKEYLKIHKYCKRCGTLAVDIHHKAGRLGSLLTNEAYFMALCRKCHTWVHDNSKEAKEQGYIIKVK